MYRFWIFTLLKLTLIALLGVAVALLFNLPVQRVLPYVQLPPSMRLAGIDGTVLKGKASELRISGFPLRGIRYRYMPSCIPLLKVCYHVVYNRGEIRVAFDLLNGDSEVSQSKIDYPVADLLRLLPDEPPANPSGRLQLRIDDLSMQGDKLVAVKGRLIWSDMGLNDDGIRIDIGDYQVDFQGDPQQYEFTFSDLNAALDVSGDGKIGADGFYQVDVRIDGETGIEPHVKAVLNQVATRTGVNKYRIRQKGRLSRETRRQLFR
jgi:hypothetical protein